MEKYKAIRNAGGSPGTKRATLRQLADPELLEDEEPHADEAETKVSNKKGMGRGKKRKQRNSRKRKIKTTVWKEFQLGISNVELYPENASYIQTALDLLANKK